MYPLSQNKHTHETFAGDLFFEEMRGDACIRTDANTQESQTDASPYHDGPPISIATLLQKHPALLAESSVHTSKLYHDLAPICIAILLQKYEGSGAVGTLKKYISKRQAVSDPPHHGTFCPLYAISRLIFLEILSICPSPEAAKSIK